MKDEFGHIDEIENLIKNDSGQEVYSIQDGDWEQLQMMMNQNNRKKAIGWMWRGGIELILILVWFLMINNEYKIENGTEKKIKIGETEVEAKNGLHESETSNLALKPQGTSEDNIKENSERTTPREEQAFSGSELFKGVGAVERPIEETPITLTRTDEHEPLAISTGIDRSTLEESRLDSIASEEEELGGEELVGVIHLEPLVIDSLRPEFEVLSESEYATPLTVNTVDSSDIIEKNALRKMHFHVGVGSEWSIASNSPVGRTKLKLQIGGEFQFLKRWSVLSGVNYTVKDYETNLENYTVQPGFWTGGIKPTSISARCDVLEIPLNVRYYFTPQNRMRSSFYLTAGASSYLMASERYSFTYDVQNPTLKQEWNGKWKNNHYFSVLHLSAGYQKSFRPNVSFLMEPYVDLPLTGIGFGQVNFMSFGASLKLKY